MTDSLDYVKTLGAVIRTGEAGSGISLRGHGGAIFPEIDVAELRSRFNEAMHVAVTYYAACVADGGVEFTTSQTMEVSFRVVLWCLHRRERAVPPRPLCLERTDLMGTDARDLCWVYCETTFPADYVRYAAALAEMSIDQFKQYERERRPLLLDMGMLR